MFAPVLLASAALAAPLVPLVPPTPGVDVAVGLGTGVDRLREAGCDAGDCDAVRSGTSEALQVGVQLAPVVGVYAHGHLLREELAAAGYEGEGWGAAAGVRASVPIGPAWGLWAWAEVDHARSTSTSSLDVASAATRWQVEAAVLAHVGDPRDGVAAWAGVQGVPWAHDRSLVIDGDVPLDLEAPLPVEGVLGAAFLSDPLGGPWSRARLTVGIQGTAGARTSVSGWLGVEL